MKQFLYILLAIGILYIVYRFSPSAGVGLAALTLILLLINRADEFNIIQNLLGGVKN